MNFNSLKVDELKAKLRSLGIKEISGKKADLIQRLQNATLNEKEDISTTSKVIQEKFEENEEDDVLPELQSSNPMKSNSFEDKTLKDRFNSFWFLSMTLLVASLAMNAYHWSMFSTVTSNLRAKHESYCSQSLKEETKAYEDMIENLGREKLELIKKVDLFKEKKEQAENAYKKYKAAYEKLKGSLSTDDPPPVDPEAAPKDDDEDDKEEDIFCWFDSIFGNFFFPGSCTQTPQSSSKRPGCPFKSVDHAMQELRLRPEWIQLQQQDRYSKARKKLINELSRTLHPDKLTAQGCPPEYGDGIMKELNSMRTERPQRSRSD